MTRESAKKNWEIIKAFAEGAEVQFLNADGEWFDSPTPSFFDHLDYRIKPAIEKITEDNGIVFTTNTTEDATKQDSSEQ